MAYNLKGYKTINGTSGNDDINGGTRNEAIYGNGGTDRLNGGGGSDVLFGSTTGNTTFEYNADALWLIGSSAVNTGDPSGSGAGAAFSLSGYGRSHDVFVGSGSNNTLELGDGHNALFLDDPFSPGADSIRLHNVQTIVGGSGGQIIDLTSSQVSYGNVTIIGGSGSDVIMSNAGDDTVSGGDGNDYIWGGSGNDSLSGGTGSDQLLGATGNDTLDGGTGADAMTGGAGDDTYVVDDAGDTTVEAANAGIDLVLSSLSHTLGANLDNLTLTGTAAINGTGNALSNVITGNGADNVLDGGAGADTLRGGAGNDIYVADNGGDTVVEAAGEGIDLVLASATTTLGANIENLTLIGTGSINGTGNDLANVITGNSDGNVLDGGSSADTLSGGAGDDTYVIDHTGDTVVEAADQGLDLVLASATTTLGANVENLTLTGTATINGTGNALANLILGNAAANSLAGGDGNDTLDGGNGDDILDGGAGVDVMTGGAGNDTYVIDSASDVIVESVGAGVDLVQSSITHALHADVDNLTLSGTGAINGTGNVLNNIITGNVANNVIDGGDGNDTIRAGKGDDHLTGGQGNDSIFGEDGNDVLLGGDGKDNLNGGAGLDTVYAGTGDDGIFGGGANDVVYGEDGNDKIYGDGGNDLISGGKGDDWLVGGQLSNGYSVGNDTFAYTLGDVLNGDGSRAGFDRIVDFGAGDRLDFSAIFNGGGGASIADLVRTTDTAAGVVVALDLGSAGFVEVLSFHHQHGFDLDDLVAGNQIVI